MKLSVEQVMVGYGCFCRGQNGFTKEVLNYFIILLDLETGRIWTYDEIEGAFGEQRLYINRYMNIANNFFDITKNKGDETK